MSNYEGQLSEGERQLLAADHRYVFDHIVLGHPIKQGFSTVKMDEVYQALETVDSEGTLIISGPNRSGKTSLLYQMMQELKNTGRNNAFFDCQKLTLNQSTEPHLMRWASYQGFPATNLSDLLRFFKENTYTVFFDELSLVANPDQPQHTHASEIESFIRHLQEQSVPIVAIIHEHSRSWREIDAHWPTIRHAPKIIPRALTADEIMTVGLYGTIVYPDEQMINPAIYRGIDRTCAEEIRRCIGGWSMVVSHLVQNFSYKNSNKASPSEHMDIPTLHQHLHEYLWDELLDSEYIRAVSYYLRQNLLEESLHDEVMDAFGLPQEYPSYPYCEDVAPLQADISSLSPGSLALLDNMRLIITGEDTIKIDGLLFSHMLNRYL